MADIILIKGNPTVNINAVKNIKQMLDKFAVRELIGFERFCRKSTKIFYK
ncbi:hypothetical protein [Clostridium sp. DMHC 10]|nr:hypothetical protein [Clostridium sp. DMHC 10]